MVRAAAVPDAPAIVEIRAAYYRARNSPVQIRDAGEWWVAEVDGEVVAVQAYQDIPGQRTITDTYCCNDRRGRMGLAKLVAACHARADAEGMLLVGMTEPDNTLNQRAMERRGYRLVAFLYARTPGAS